MSLLLALAALEGKVAMSFSMGSVRGYSRSSVVGQSAGRFAQHVRASRPQSSGRWTSAASALLAKGGSGKGVEIENRNKTVSKYLRGLTQLL